LSGHLFQTFGTSLFNVVSHRGPKICADQPTQKQGLDLFYPQTVDVMYRTGIKGIRTPPGSNLPGDTVDMMLGVVLPAIFRQLHHPRLPSRRIGLPLALQPAVSYIAPNHVLGDVEAARGLLY
jgi:hypothetical protein